MGSPRRLVAADAGGARVTQVPDKAVHPRLDRQPRAGVKRLVQIIFLVIAGRFWPKLTDELARIVKKGERVLGLRRRFGQEIIYHQALVAPLTAIEYCGLDLAIFVLLVVDHHRLAQPNAITLALVWSIKGTEEVKQH